MSQTIRSILFRGSRKSSGLFISGKMEIQIKLVIAIGRRYGVGIMQVGDKEYVVERSFMFGASQNAEQDILKELARQAGISYEDLQKNITKEQEVHL